MPAFLLRALGPLPVWGWATIAAGLLFFRRRLAPIAPAMGPVSVAGSREPSSHDAGAGRAVSADGASGGDLPLALPPSSPDAQPALVYDPASGGDSTTPTTRPPSSSGEIQTSQSADFQTVALSPAARDTLAGPSSSPSYYPVTAPAQPTPTYLGGSIRDTFGGTTSPTVAPTTARARVAA